MKKLFVILDKAFNEIPDEKLRHHLAGELLMSFFLVIFMFICKLFLCKSDDCPWFWFSSFMSFMVLSWIAWYKEYVFIPSISDSKPDKNNVYSILKGGLSVFVLASIVYINCLMI